MTADIIKKTSLTALAFGMLIGLAFAVISHIFIASSEKDRFREVYLDQIHFLQALGKETQKESLYLSSQAYIKSIKSTHENALVSLYDRNGTPVAHSDAHLDKAIRSSISDPAVKIKDYQKLVNDGRNLVKDIEKAGTGYRIKEDEKKVDLGFFIGRSANDLFARVQLQAVAESRNVLRLLILYFLAPVLGIFLAGLTWYFTKSLSRLNEPATEDNNSSDFYIAPEGYSNMTETEQIIEKQPVQPQSSETEPKGDNNTLLFLQKKLYEKPFPRLRNIEVAMFPKLPDESASNFLSGVENYGDLYLFMGRFDIQNIEANLWKHRLQEHFYALTRSQNNFDAVSKSIWRAMFDRVDFGPGMLTLCFHKEADSFDYFKNGEYIIFEHSEENEISVCSEGNDFFSSDFAGSVKAEHSQKAILGVVSVELLESLDLDFEQFKESVLGNVEWQSSAKAYLKELLNSIYKYQQQLGNTEHPPGMITVISKKS